MVELMNKMDNEIEEAVIACTPTQSINSMNSSSDGVNSSTQVNNNNNNNNDNNNNKNICDNGTPGSSRVDTSTPLEIDYNYSDAELAKIVIEEILSGNANSSSSGVVESISPSKKMKYF